jgi:3-methylcrotonyl-CoA carboxylase alpha subunit
VTTRSVVSIGDRRFALTDGEGTRLAYAATDGSRTWVFFDGRAYIVEMDAGRPGHAAPAHADDRPALASPMPATVVDVRVEPGSRVTRGEVLVTLEAMKMELPILAPRDGIVAAVHCRQGDLVQAGAPLVEMESWIERSQTC